MNTSSFGMLLTILFKRKWTLILVFLTVMLGAGAYLLLATPKYLSEAELVIRFGDRSIPSVDRVPAVELTPADRREIVLANSELLQSHELLQATIEAFGLDQVYPDIVEDPPTRWSQMDEALRVFQNNLTVDVGKDNNVITVSLLHPDKALSTKLVAKLIELYMAREAEVYRNPQVSFQREGLTQAEQRLNAATQALESLKARYAITDFDQEVLNLVKQRGDVDTSLRAAQATLAQAERRRGDLQKMMEAVPENLAATPSGEKYRSLDDAQARLSDLRSKQSQMMATYSPDSPALDQLRAGIAEAERDVGSRRSDTGRRSAFTPNPVFQTLQTDYFHAAADAESGAEPVRIYTRQLADIDARLATLQQARGPLSDALRQVQVADDVYRALYQQFESARMKESLNNQRISNPAVLSAPTEPYRTARPRKLITVLASIVAGTLLAFGAVLLIEATDDRFTSSDQLAAALGVPVLATFPKHV